MQKTFEMQRKQSLDSHPYSFLIVKMSALGDIIHALSVADYLKEKFPKCTVSWVVEERFEDLVSAASSVDVVYPISIKSVRKNFFSLLLSISSFRKNLKKQTFDVVLDLQGNTKSAFVLSLIKAKKKVGFSRSCVSEWPNLLATHSKIDVDLSHQISSQYLTFVRKYFLDEETFLPKPIFLADESPEIFQKFHQEQRAANRKILMICPGSNWENKRLSDDVLKNLLQRLETKFDLSFVFIYGSEKEKIFAEQLTTKYKHATFLGRLQISKWQALMREVDLVFAVDSSALHLASIGEVPTFSVFGPSSLSVYKPSGSLHKGIQGTCPYGKTFVKHCPLLRTCKTGACIKEIKVDDLEKSFSKFYESLFSTDANCIK
ncbi:hypothetical protein COB11_01205 [Candidatus Aerophobetes bacterium]|uniref:Lipopolysaccharide heptosyltransferase I n=1 Tax=Aerophobetes bacterium TaxID=2030807 RepID=A0A2A4YMB6_UNCAE|nr:MAG: hypothetical protein COB11_01205 [Candidatus Aerophobetes bacterium]